MTPEGLALQFGFKLTVLRGDILQIFLSDSRPLKAYEVLEQLKAKRHNAEPPTVYRVLDFLVDHHVLHRLDSCHAYVICDLGGNDATQVQRHLMLLCRSCHDTYEVVDPTFQRSLDKISRAHNFQLQDHCIELTGSCTKCQ